jgi:carbamoyltransferase
LMSAARAENKDVLNARVKFREPFRPFCPTLLAEHRDRYLQGARHEGFMITAFDATDHARAAVPAVVHVDGTVRPQLLDRASNPLYHRLIERFGELTGEHLIINTSMNLMGEPMVCHPREAIRCFYDSGLDLLALGPYLLTKPGPGALAA